MKRIILLFAFLLSLGCAVSAAQGSKVLELRDLLSPGHNVAVVFKDLTDDIDEKDAYIKDYLRAWSEWVVVEDVNKADFILYVEGYSIWSEYSHTSKTYFMTASIQNPARETIWEGEPVYDWANLGNGLRAVRGVSRQLVRSLLLDLRKVIGETPVIVTV